MGQAPGQQKAGQAADRAVRRASVLSYAAANPRSTIRQIADALKLPKSTVQTDLDVAIKETIGRSADAYRAAMIARAESIVDVALHMALSRGSVPHAQLVLAADKRISEMLGLDAPKRTEVTGKDGGAIQHDHTGLPELIAAAAAATGVDPALIAAGVDRLMAEETAAW